MAREKYDWDKIKAKYLSGSYKNLRDFAEKESINYDVLRRKASKWQVEKSQTSRTKVTKIVTKTIEKIAEKESDRNARILNISDKLADKIEKAVEQLENYIVTNKVKTKTITYDPAAKKPSKEVIVEEETKDIVSGIIDRQGLNYLTAALERIQKGQRIAEGLDKVEDVENNSVIKDHAKRVQDAWANR
ncbi:hypothetical protein [Pelosinus fermentans]|uniref:Uncharacterized protein n=1 Tax=Pelosinus fermentans JBW45 TaxID=1192197 RepID=I9DCF8_9FIRM|nr:hypothetical protein [Pelosinus fermentans]AJQ26906.1 hypothetical protein JBW_01556 [Pelosinus fermentans JBW45]